MSQPDSSQSPRDNSIDSGAADLLASGITDITDLQGRVVDSAEDATEPSRNPDFITAVLGNTNHGAGVKVVFGTSEWKVSLTGEVVGIKGQRCSRPPNSDWTKVIEILGPEGTEERGRLYRMGTGGSKTAPWLIYSYDYHQPLDMITQEDAAWHGWIIDVQRLPDGW